MTTQEVQEVRDLSSSEVEKSENHVKACMKAFECFTNPFTIDDNNDLSNISSGSRVPEDVKTSLLDAEKLGHQEKETFIKSRPEKNDVLL